ncbi:MAG: Na+/H+ antiporter subunit G [Spirochaetales bacterium]|nr:Na+/H+ antiporter subunit G [Spirochaetales bacterium]
MTIAGNVLVLLGSAFLVLGGLGLLRMPDVYNRLQAGTKATTLGAMSVLLGSAFLAPGLATKAVLVIVFIALANPISSSTIARSAYKAGIPLAPVSVRDDLKSKEAAE